MAAARCARCNTKRAHPVHIKALGLADYHAFEDATRAGLKPLSDARRAYQKSEAHQQAIQATGSPRARTRCPLTGEVGIPRCRGMLTLHHTAPRARAGGLKRAEQFPVVLVCAFHNEWLSQTVEGQRWGRSHTFERNGSTYPFLMTAQQIEQGEVK